jgi:uncharacterized protein (DUF983 family)
VSFNQVAQMPAKTIPLDIGVWLSVEVDADCWKMTMLLLPLLLVLTLRLLLSVGVSVVPKKLPNRAAWNSRCRYLA